MPDSFDIVIVGGGPVGSTLSYLLSKKGYNVALIEEHREIGIPVHCAGLLGKRAWDSLPIKPSHSIIEKVSSFKIFSFKGEEIEIPKFTGYVVDRSVFDKGICASAVETGVSLYKSTRCVAYSKLQPPEIICKTYSGLRRRFRGRVIVGADGALSKVAKIFGFPPLPVRFGLQLIAGPVSDLDSVEVHFLRLGSINTFYWIIPSPKEVKVGIVFPLNINFGSVRNLLRKEALNKKLTTRRFSTWFLPTKPRRKTVKGRTLLVGDAAGQNKPLSFGGIFFGVSAAKIAAKNIVMFLEENKRLTLYEKEWRKFLLNKIRIGLIGRTVFENYLSNELERFFQRIKESESEIINLWDIDSQEKLLFHLFKKSFSPYFLMRKSIFKLFIVIPYIFTIAF